MPFFTSISFTPKPFLRETVLIFFKNKDPSNFQNLITTCPFYENTFLTPILKNCSPPVFKTQSQAISKTPLPYTPFSPLFFILNKIYIKFYSKTPFTRNCAHIFQNKDPRNFQNLITTCPFTRILVHVYF